MASRAEEEAEAEKLDEMGPRTRRASVRRMRQAEKNNKMKESIKEEVMMRRESMIRQVSAHYAHYSRHHYYTYSVVLTSVEILLAVRA